LFSRRDGWAVLSDLRRRGDLLARVIRERGNRREFVMVLIEQLEPRLMLTVVPILDAPGRLLVQGDGNDDVLCLRVRDGLVEFSQGSVEAEYTADLIGTGQSFALTSGAAVVVDLGDGRNSLYVDSSLFAALASVGGELTFFGGQDLDALFGPSQDSLWQITGPDTGTLNHMVAFHNVEYLIGAADNEDVFAVLPGGSLTGRLDGGDAGYDTLVIEGDYESAILTAQGPHSGTVELNGRLLRYDGLEPIVLPGGTDEITIVGSDGDDPLILEPFNGGYRVRSTTGSIEEVQFSEPASSLTIQGGVGNDSLTIATGVSLSTASLSIEAESIVMTAGGVNAGGGIDLDNTSTALSVVGDINAGFSQIILRGSVVIPDGSTTRVFTGSTVVFYSSLALGSTTTSSGEMLTTNGNLAFAGSASVAAQIGSTAGQVDQIVVNGTVTLGGATFNGSLVDVDSPPPVNSEFTFIINDLADAVVGNFASGATATVDGRTFAINKAGGDGNDIVLTNQRSTRIWDGGSAITSNWSDRVNWVDDLAVAVGDALVFSGTARLTPSNDFTAGTSFQSIAFMDASNPGDPGCGNFVIGGNAIAVAGGGNAIDVQTGMQTFSGMGINAAAVQTYSIVGSSVLNFNSATLTLDSGVTIAGSGNFNTNAGGAIDGPAGLTVNLTGGTATLNGAVGDGAVVGSLTIANSGGTTFNNTLVAGTVALNNTTGTISFNDDTTITGGLGVAAQSFNVAFTGATNTIAGATAFLNLGTVTIGNDGDDTCTFIGGIDTSGGPSTTVLAGTIATTNAAMTFGATALSGGPVTLNSNGGAIQVGPLTGAQNLTLAAGIGGGTTTFTGAVTNLGSGTGAALTVADGVTGLVRFQSTLGANSGLSAAAGTAVRFDNDVTLANGDTGTNLAGTTQLDGLTFSGFDGLAFNAVVLSGGPVGLVGNGSAVTVDGQLSLNGQPLMVNGDAVFNGAIDLSVNGAGASDEITVTGATTLAGPLNVTLNYEPTAGDSCIIVNVLGPAAIAGGFTNLLPGGVMIIDGIAFKVSYEDSTGNDVSLTAFGPLQVLTFDANTPANYVDGSDNMVNVQMTGPGNGEVLVAAGLDALSVSVDNSTEKSKVKMEVLGWGVETSVGEFIIAGSLALLRGDAVDLIGDVQVAGSLLRLVLGDIAGPSVISIGLAAPRGMVMTFDEVADLEVNVAGRIARLTASQWVDPVTANTITAASIGRLIIKGHFQADLNLDGSDTRRRTLGEATLGSMSHADWQMVGDLGRLKVRGAVDNFNLTLNSAAGRMQFGTVQDTTIDVDGSIGAIVAQTWLGGSIKADTLSSLDIRGGDFAADLTLDNKAGAIVALSRASVRGWVDEVDIRVQGNVRSFAAMGMRNSNLFVGVGAEVVDLPDDDSDFQDNLTLQSLRLTGALGAGSSFIDSNVAAWTIGSARLTDAQLDNSGQPFGLAAGAMGSLHLSQGGQSYVYPGRWLPDPGDLEIRLV
jgi:hypothetical protein